MPGPPNPTRRDSVMPMRILETFWRGLQHLQTAHWLAVGVVGAVPLAGSAVAPILGMSTELAGLWVLTSSAGISLVVSTGVVYLIGHRRPRFRVELIPSPLDDLQQPIRLQVTNDGPTAEFEAQVVALDGDDRHHHPPWHLRWQAWDAPRKQILNGDRYVIELAQWEPDPTPSTGGSRPGFRFATIGDDPHIAPDQTGLCWSDDLYKQPIRLTVKVSSVRPVSHQFVTVFLRLAPYGYEAKISDGSTDGSQVPLIAT